MLFLCAGASLGERVGKADVPTTSARYEPKPIPCGPDAPTVWRYRQEKGMPFFRKQMVEPFKTSVEIDKPWAAEVSKALENQCSEIFEERLMDQEAAWKQADAWVKAGCAYPVVRWMQAMGFHKGKKKEQALGALKALDADLAAAPCPWFARMLVGIGYRTVDPSPANEALFAARFVEWLENGGVTKADSRHVRWLIEQLGSASYPTLVDAFEKSPKVDPWLTLILRGRIARRAAWDARGSGYASTVTKDGWSGFEKGIKEAKAAYEEAWRLHPEFPEAASLMVDICGSTCGGEMREWFDRAVALEMDMLGPYSSYVWYSRPRWGGSVEMMTAFAEACYATHRHDTMVPSYYATIMFQTVEDLNCNPKEVFARADVHAKCVEVLLAQVKNEKSFKNIRDMSAELLPVVEYLGGDLHKAVEYNRLRKGVSNKSSWTFLRDDFYQIYDILNGLKWSNGEALLAAEELYRAGRYAEALAAYVKIRGEAKLNGQETDYVVHRIDGVNLATAFPQGAWIAPTFNDRYSGWLNFNLKWRKDGNGFRTDKEKCPLEWINPLPDDVEYEGVFRFVSPARQVSKVCFQLDKYGDNVAGWPAILFDYADGRCRVATGGRYDQPDTEWATVTCEQPEARFRIVSHGNKVSVWVNGVRLVDGRDMSRYMRSFKMDGTRRLFLYGTRVALGDLRMRSSAVARAEE